MKCSYTALHPLPGVPSLPIELLCCPPLPVPFLCYCYPTLLTDNPLLEAWLYFTGTANCLRLQAEITATVPKGFCTHLMIHLTLVKRNDSPSPILKAARRAVLMAAQTNHPESRLHVNQQPAGRNVQQQNHLLPHTGGSSAQGEG